MLWHSTRRLKKGFRERKTRLKRNGMPVPWSQNHQVIAEHLAQVQWGPSNVTEKETTTLKESPPLHPPHSEEPSPVTGEELDTVLATARKNKALSPDYIRAELILLLDNGGQDELLSLRNCCLSEKQSPAKMENAFLVSIYKCKGATQTPLTTDPFFFLVHFTQFSLRLYKND